MATEYWQDPSGNVCKVKDLDLLDKETREARLAAGWLPATDEQVAAELAHEADAKAKKAAAQKLAEANTKF